MSLIIKEMNFKILDHKRFSPSSKGLFEPPYLEFGGKPCIKCTFNPTKKDYSVYPYLPRLTIMKVVRRGGFPIFLKVEFSIPKLLYGNNFDEVDESDFGEICWKLKEVLLSMGVLISDIKTISYAEVSTLHPSKNIILTDYSIPLTVIKEISKVNVNKLLDMNQTDYRNGGYSIKYHSNDYEIIFYDKLADLKQAKISDNRAIEEDNLVQLNLFEKVEMKKPFEVLRMEVRLGSKRKIRETLKKLGYDDKDITFVKLFNNKLAQDILMDTVNRIESGYPVLLKEDSKSNEDFLIQLMINNPKMKFKNGLAMVGVRNLLSEIGTRNFRNVTEKYDKSNWYRLNKEMGNLNINKQLNPFVNIKEALTKFKTVRLENYKDKM